MWAGVSILLVAPAGVALKLYAGPGREAINNWASSILYEVFWMLVVFLLIPKRAAITPVAAGVLAGTCVLEVMQLWHPPFLEAIRASFIGRAVIGTTFDWLDFTAYVLGCLAGWGWLRILVRGVPAACGRRT
jgi:hypothetical protein